ncbi:hypothetical protein [Streptomyces sp. NPDC005385]|uniref:hypothetical protein n=1 Tax=Streptomyces sp. NPDC005385 TaxID=3157039 RepID=UPI00339FA7E8
MSAPPQARPNTSVNAERNARIFRMRVAGLTERQIADQVGLAPSTVHGIIATAIRERVEPEVDELRRLAQERLDDQRRSINAVRSRPHFVAQAGKIVKDDDGLPLVDDGPILAANAALLKLEEREARLYGYDRLDAALVQRMELEAQVTTGAILGTLDDIFRALPDLDTRHREALRGWAVERAQAHVDSIANDTDGEPPVWTEPPRPQLALPPGTSEPPSPARSPHAWPTAPDDPPRVPHDGAEAVLDALADFEEQYGGLDAEDEA